MKRMGMVINLRPEKVDAYKQLHADVWSEIIEKIRECNIRNYSIYLKEPENILFGYWEYHGENFADDANKMAQDETTQRWWELCSPCQEPFKSKAEGEWWAMMEEVFHCD